MNKPSAGPVWLQGPIAGIPGLLQPVAHTFAIGLLVHAGDHTYRHVGQAITTAKVVMD